MVFRKTLSNNLFNIKSANRTSQVASPAGPDPEAADNSPSKLFDASENYVEEGTMQIGQIIQVDEFGEPLERASAQPVGITFPTEAGGELIIHADGSYEYHAPDQWYLSNRLDDEMTEFFKYAIYDTKGRLLEESILTVCMTQEGPVAYSDYVDWDRDASTDGFPLPSDRPISNERDKDQMEGREGSKWVRAVIYEGKTYSLSEDHTYISVDGTSYNHFNGRTLFLDTAIGGQFQIDMVGDTAGEYLYTAPDDFYRRVTMCAKSMQETAVEKKDEGTHKFIFTLAPGIDASSVIVMLKANHPEVAEANGYWYVYRDGELLAQNQFIEKFQKGIARLELTSSKTREVFDQLVLHSSEVQVQVESATFDLNGNIKEQVGYILENTDGIKTSSVLTIALGEEADNLTIVDHAPVLDDDQMTIIQVVGKQALPESIAQVGIVSESRHGLVRVNNDHTITYIPHLNYLGTDHFIYQTLDMNGDIRSSEIHLAINPANPVAVAVDNQYITFTNQDLVVSSQHLLEQDENMDTHMLKIHSCTQPQNGTLIAQEDDTLIYRPHKNFTGGDHFSYSVLNMMTNDMLGTKTIAIEVQKADVSG